MDIKELLKTEGLSDEDIATLTGNDKYVGVLNKFVEKAEAGDTALQTAQQIQNDLKTWNETQVVPYVQKADERVAAAEARLAGTAAYLKGLKDQGYDVPDSYLEAPPQPAKKESSSSADNGIDRKYVQEQTFQSARANMALISLSERARDLLGHGLDVEAEYDDFGKNRRGDETLRAYIDRKYDLSGIAKKKEAEKVAKHEEELRQEGRKAALAEYQQAHGSNPETIVPRSSRFDRIASNENRRQLWQTAAGREQATRDRLAKYSGRLQ